MESIRAKIGEGVFYGSIGNFVVKIFGAIGYFLIVSKLSLHDYGVFILLTTVIGPASALTFFSLDRIFVSNYSKARAERNWAYVKGIFRDYYVMSSVAFVGLVILVFFAKDILSQYFDLYLADFFWGTCALVASQILMNQVSIFLEANEKFKQISILQTSESLSRVVFIVFVIIYSSLSITSVLFIYTAAKFVSVLVGMLQARPLLIDLMAKPFSRERGVVSRILWTTGKWEIMRNVFEQIVQPLKYVLIKIFVNVEGVAIFDFARNVYAFFVSIFPVSKTIFPIISRNITDKEKIYLIVSKAKKYSLLSYLLMYVAVLIFTVPVLKYFFPQYLGSQWIIYLVLLHFVSDVYKIGQLPLLYAHNKQRFIFLITPVFLFSQILFDVVFVSTLGLVGIVLSWHMQGLMSGYIYNRYIHKNIGIPHTPASYFFQYDSYDRLILSGIFGYIGRTFFRR